jgi:hypothetical protein
MALADPAMVLADPTPLSYPSLLSLPQIRRQEGLESPLPPGQAPPWLSAAGLALVALPWAFWITAEKDDNDDVHANYLSHAGAHVS